MYCIVKRNKNTPRVNRIPSGLPDIIALLVQYMWFSDFDCWGNIDNIFQELLDALLYGGFFSLKKRYVIKAQFYTSVYVAYDFKWKFFFIKAFVFKNITH